MTQDHVERPPCRAITMWDFSWLERRWPGAGYEDWDLALDQLQERGYNAVRIDVYPHLVAAGAEREWELLPQWTIQDWGAAARTRVQVEPHLTQFLQKCAERDIQVGLSSWFRKDLTDTRMNIRTPQDLGQVWLAVLDAVRDAGLLGSLLYVDLCNEFPIPAWAPFLHRTGYDVFKRDTPQGSAGCGSPSRC